MKYIILIIPTMIFMIIGNTINGMLLYLIYNIIIATIILCAIDKYIQFIIFIILPYNLIYNI
jgi:hypothetical protein